MSVSKIVAAAASSAGGAGLDIDEVFSTFLYDGTGSTQTITNGIDLTEGGLVWAKSRSSRNHILSDTARGTGKVLFSNSTSAEDADATTITSYNSNGFTMGSSTLKMNTSGEDFVSWTWRKAPKFFDVVTWTGNASNRAISYNLGSVPAMIIVKSTSVATDWTVYHVGIDATSPENYHIVLNSTAARSNVERWNSTAPTSTEFTVGASVRVNGTGETYVAYLFAHNNNDGEFGPDGDQDIIKCGSYTGNGSTTGPVVNLGFEPQFVMIKTTDNLSRGWAVQDSMRGMVVGGADQRLRWDSNGAEGADNGIAPTSTGFQVETTSTYYNGNGNNYIYMAIRRGPLAAPDDATKVFHVDRCDSDNTQPYVDAPFPVDFGWWQSTTGGSAKTSSRLTQGQHMLFRTTSAESANSNFAFDYMNGWYASALSTNHYGYSWKRAPSYFDVVAYQGTGSSSARAVPHNLGVVPEMMWVKRRDSNSGEGWAVYHKGLNGGTDPEDYYVSLNSTSAEANNFYRWADTAPTATNFYVTDNLDASGGNLIAYLFATVAGVSKVGSYTGDGTTDGSKVIDCGFSSGARFVFTKRTDATGSWYVHDTVRGIVASGNDPVLQLNNTAAENTFDDYIDPHSSGFSVKSSSLTNASGGSYIFYAIA